jgi:translation initiation factor 2 beta subunit (eIF-2beta)/eIF-5
MSNTQYEWIGWIERKVIEYANEFGRPDNKAYFRKALEEAYEKGKLDGSTAISSEIAKNLEHDTDFISMIQKAEREKIQEDIKSVLNILEGETDRKKIVNYIREYLLQTNNK